MDIYGIPNCDTVKKALRWLDEKGLAYEFHNFKLEGVTKAKLNDWIDKKGWDIILNTKSATYRKLIKEGLKEANNKASAVRIMTEHTSTIKRPIIEKGGMLIVGFNDLELSKLLKTT